MVKKKTKKKTKKKSVKKKSFKDYKPPEPIKVTFTPGPKITAHPTAGPKVQEFEDDLDRQLADGNEPPPSKRGPGRPPKEKVTEPPEPELTIDVVAGVVKIPFELWSISQSVKSLALRDDEAKRIAEPALKLLEHYLPHVPVIAYAWISMSVSTFWVMQSRLRTIKEVQINRKRMNQETRPAEPSGPGVVTKFPEKIEPEKV